MKYAFGSIAQLGEHLPYKQGVTGSSPVVPTNLILQLFCGAVVQLVRTPACHAGGRGFKSLPRRHFYASVAQLVEQRTENPRVAGSIPAGGTICECSSSGRAPPCQGGGSEFEPRHSLQFFLCPIHSPGQRGRSGSANSLPPPRVCGVPQAHRVGRCGPRKSGCCFCRWCGSRRNSRSCGCGSEFEPRHSLYNIKKKCDITLLFGISLDSWRHSQVVRQGSAKS